MKKLVLIIFLFTGLIYSQSNTSFPLEIGNKWYYKAGSTEANYFYGVKKEITDTLSNGFKQVIAEYFYQDSTSIKTELWAYIDGKFYINDFNTIYYNDYLTADTCSSTGALEICWHLIPFQIFGILDTAQIYSDWFRFHGATGEEVTIFPEIGIVKVWRYLYYPPYVSEDSIYLVGVYRNGEFLGDTVITGINDYQNIIPNEFILYQNYPNPFNPSTKISWQTPVSGRQTLKVYDVLGNEVATLVNEYISAGSYEIEFNPSSIKHHASSGIYFYRLQAGDYVETKKMIYLK